MPLNTTKAASRGDTLQEGPAEEIILAAKRRLVMTKTWIRLSAAIAVLALLGLSAGPARAGNYKLTSLVNTSSNPGVSPPGFTTAPSINNHGHVAWQSWNVEGDSVILVHDGTTASVVFNLTDAGFGGGLGNPVINDAGAIAITACGNRCVVRINPDGTATVLATADPINGTGDFHEFEYWMPMNNSGQVAVKVYKHDGTRAVVRLDGPGITEIATQTETLINLGHPSINDSGRVAFSAQQLDPEQPSGYQAGVYSGTGGALVLEGTPPGVQGFSPPIRSDGLVLDTAGASPALIYTAQGGAVNVLVVGDEDPVLAQIRLQPAQSDFGGFVFGTQSSGADYDFGLFTGNDPSQHTVIRREDAVFGGTVISPPGTGLLPLATGLHYLNNAGQIVFYLLVDHGEPGTHVHHLVRADPLNPADLVVSALSAAVTGGAGAAITGTDTTKNLGLRTSVPSTTQLYLSANNTLSEDDVALGSRPVSALAQGTTSPGPTQVTIPADTEPGSYFLIAKADADGVNPEKLETNNTRSRAIKIGPDLTVPALTTPAGAAAGAAINVTDTTKNALGASPADPSITRFFLSTNATIGAGDIELGQRGIDTLAPGATSADTTSLTIPVDTAPGSYFIVAQSDADNALFEWNDNNNTRAKAIKIGPDLIVSAVTAPSSAAAGATVTLKETTKNKGGASTVVTTTTRYYLSLDTVADDGDTVLEDRTVGVLAAGTSSATTLPITIPQGTSPGSYFILAVADDDTAVLEILETNNKKSRAITVTP